MHRLRWRLCKTLKVAVDDPVFMNINSAQYSWYFQQMEKDEQEKFEFMRDIAEHNAMFSNPEGVAQVRDTRKNTFATNPEDFEKSVKELFGRELKTEEVETNLEEVIKNNSRQAIVNPYLNMELDEVKFTPIRGK